MCSLGKMVMLVCMCIHTQTVTIYIICEICKNKVFVNSFRMYAELFIVLTPAFKGNPLILSTVCFCSEQSYYARLKTCCIHTWSN